MDNEVMLSWQVLSSIMGVMIPIKVKHIFWSCVIYKCYTSRRNVYNNIYWYWKNYVA